MKNTVLFLSIICSLSPKEPSFFEDYLGGELPVAKVTATNTTILKLAQISYAEGRGEPDTSIQDICQVVLNRSKRDSMTILDVISKRGKFDGYNNSNYCLFEELKTSRDSIKFYKFYNLCKEVYNNEPRHNYHYFLNPKTSTDSKWVKYGLRQNGKYSGSQWFF